MKSNTKHLSLGLFLLRLAVGGVFVYHGLTKFMNMEGTIGFFGQLGFGAWFAYLIATIELVGGVLTILGVCTAVTALLFVVIMLGAIIKVKLGMMNDFSAAELDLVMLASALAIFFAGPGSWAIKKPASNNVPAQPLSTTTS